MAKAAGTLAGSFSPEATGRKTFKRWLQYFYDAPAHLLDYANDVLLIFDEYTHLKERVKSDSEEEQWLIEKPLHRAIDQEQPLIFAWEQLAEKIRFRVFFTVYFGAG